MALHASIKVEIPKFDGRNGPVQAKFFLAQLEAVRQTQQIPQDKMQALVVQSLVYNSPAWIWYITTVADDTNKLSWDFLKQAFRNEFCKSLTLDQLHKEEAKLVKRGDESISDFFYRVKFFHQSKDFNISSDEKVEEGYRRQLDYRIRDSFLKGLPTSIVSKFMNLDVYTASSTEVLDMAIRVVRTDMTDLSHKINAVSLNSAKQPKDINTLVTEAVNSAFRSFQSGNNKQPTQRGQSNPNSNRNIPPPADKSMRPSPEELAKRSKQRCGRCRLLSVHRTRECWVPLDAQGKPFPRGRRRRADEVDAVTSLN